MQVPVYGACWMFLYQTPTVDLESRTATSFGSNRTLRSTAAIPRHIISLFEAEGSLMFGPS